MPALAKKVDLVVGVDASFQMESQMQVQQGWRRTGTRGGAFFRQGFFPGCIGAEAGGAADGGVLALQLPVEHDLCGGIAADFFIGQDGHQAFLQGSKAAFDLAFGLRADLEVVDGIGSVNVTLVELPEDLLKKQLGEAFGDLLFLIATSQSKRSPLVEGFQWLN